MGVFTRIAIAVVLALVAERVTRFIIILDLSKTISYHEPGPCHLVPNVEEGSEDMQVLSNGIALVTSGMRFPPPGGKLVKHRKGKILKFDFNNPEAGVEEVKIVNRNEMPELNPHGISLWEDSQTRQISVFVVNHPVDEDIDFISIFNYDTKSNSLKHLRSISHKDFGLLNDVVAVGPESFYTTRFHYSRTNPLTAFAETFLGIKLGGIFYYDGQDATQVESGLIMANGINKSPDSKKIYVASSADRAVKVYNRNKDNSLTFIRNIPIGTLVDNINIDKENGDLWIGSHPVGIKVFQHMDDPNFPAPSQVLRLRIKGDQQHFLEEVFSEPSTRLYGSTVAERYKDAILIGTIQHKMMYCKLNHISSYHG